MKIVYPFIIEYDDVKISCSNFCLSRRDQDLIQKVMEKIRDQVPLYSSITLELNRFFKTYVGNLKIQSSSVSFKQQAKAMSLKKMIKELDNQLSEEISEWRRNRFVPLYHSSNSGNFNKKELA